MARYTKQDKDGRYYIESANGKLESDTKGHTYGEAIDRFAELEADVVPRSEVERLTIELEAMRGSANSYKMQYEQAQAEKDNLIATYEACMRTYAEQLFDELEKLTISRMIKDVPLIDDRLITDIAKLKKKYIGEKS